MAIMSNKVFFGFFEVVSVFMIKNVYVFVSSCVCVCVCVMKMLSI